MRMRAFTKLIKREFRLFWRNSVLKMLFIGAPLLYGIMFGLVYQKGKVTDLPIIVVDEDNSSTSSRLIDMLDDNEVIKIARLLPSMENIKDISIREEATSVVVIPKGFGADIQYKRYPEIKVFINTSNILTANFASRALQTVTGTLKAGVQMEALRKTGMPNEMVLRQYEPFAVSYVKNYNQSGNYMYFLWPGMLATILQQVLLLAMALTFAKEFEYNTFSFVVNKARSPLVAIIAKCLPYLFMSFLIWLVYGIMHVYYKVPLGNGVGMLTLVAGLFVLAACMMGILVSILIPNQLKATEVLMVFATPSFVISGFTWPLSQMPRIVQLLADLIPLTHFLKAYRVLVIEGGSSSEALNPILYLVGLCVLFGIPAWIAVARKFKAQRKA